MIRVFTAFSGYDSQCLALNVLNRDYPVYVTYPGQKADKPMFYYELVGWSEIDKYAIKAHNALFPQWADRNYGDISKIDWETVPDFDLFTYSSPCQDFSQAGKQKGAEKGSGTRSSLLWECERAIRIKRPKYLLFENVAAVASKKFVKLFNSWQLTLEQMGYTNFTQILNAKTHGYPTPVPQNRERLFMVSILNCDQPFYFPDAQPLTSRLVDVLETDVDESYYLSDVQIGNMQRISKGNGFDFNPKSPNDIAQTLAIQKWQKNGYIYKGGNIMTTNEKEARVAQVITAIDGLEVMDAVEIFGKAINKCQTKQMRLIPMYYIGKLIEEVHGRSALIKINDDGSLSFSLAANGVAQEVF